MNFSRKILLILLASTAFLSCKNNAKPVEKITETTQNALQNDTIKATKKVMIGETDFDAMAQEMCDCTPKFVENIKRIAVAKKSGNADLLKKLVTDAGEINSKLTDCAQKVSDKYGKEAAKNGASIDALLKICPEFVQMMELQQQLMQGGK